MVQETEKTTETIGGGFSRKLKKVVGMKRGKTAEENQPEARNDGAVRKVYDTSTQPAKGKRSNINIIMKNRSAGKSIDDARLVKQSSKDESTDHEDVPESSEEQKREPEEGLLVQAEKAFLGLGYYVGEGAVAGCKKVAELTKGTQSK